MPRSSASSSLPEFRLANRKLSFFTDDDGELKLTRVTCPRGDCGEEFCVDLEAWHRNSLPTRPCPYCFKTAIIPGRDPTVSNHLGAP